MLSLALQSFAQTLDDVVEREREGMAIRIVSYNVENLFDTIADGSSNDEEFLPSATKNYNSSKYWHKIGNLAKVIRAVGGWDAPEIVGLVEIENRGVLLDLISHASLKQANFKIAHYDSPDPRGIDVALLFDSTIASVLHVQRIEINEQNLRTRDILYVKLLVASDDTLHAFVNHWSSRRGGKEASSYKREIAASILKRVTDSIQKNNFNAKILVMGDFNDSPVDPSIQLLVTKNEFALTNLTGNFSQTEGTYKYRGVWDVIDQILVSSALLNQNVGLKIPDNRAYIFKKDFLLVADEKYGDYYPKRCWRGDFYIGGFSDHLPVFVDVSFKN